MSINSMTNVAMTRRTDYAEPDAVAATRREIAKAAEGAAAPQSPVTAALAVIVTYIPTEVLTLYVAVLAAIKKPNDTSSSGVYTVFWAFLFATPIIVWLVYAAKIRSDNKPLPKAFREWPKWEMVAATVSYVAWAVSFPDAPFLANIGLPTTLAAVIVLVTAAILGLLAPVFQRPIKPAAG